MHARLLVFGRGIFVSLLMLLPGFAGCSRAMHDDGRMRPLEKSALFTTQLSAREPVPGTVPRNGPDKTSVLYSGKISGEYSVDIPIEVSEQTLRRGRENYDAFCAPCHDRAGLGNGIIVQRGFKRPVPFSDERLLQARAGYLFDTITRGYRTMLPMASQIPAEERWEIVAYIRALQLSQHASLSQLPPQEQTKFTSEK